MRGVKDMKYSKHKNKQEFLKGKGFYLVLAATIAALGIAAWSAAATISSVDDDISSNYSSIEPEPPVSSSVPQGAEQTGQNVSDVSDNREDVSSQKPTSSKPEQTGLKGAAIMMPFSGSVGKNYSDKKLQYSKTYGDMRLHLGIDLQAAEGTGVVAMANGKVEKVSEDPLYGKTVIINHFGYSVHYSGLKNITVTEGEEIAVGIKVGEIGIVPCEREDKSHVHFAAFKDGKSVSPTELLALMK